MGMLRDETVTILEQRKINGKYYKLVFRSKGLARNVRPGQFVNVRLENATYPFLRRPFSYYRILRDRVEILYEVLGQGTALLARKRAGDRLKILGPLGKGFSRKIGKRKRILVAGGCGLPPLVFFAERFGADHLFIGARSKREVLPPRELAHVKARVAYATDDGSYGAKGMVTLLLEDLIRKNSGASFFIQTCGPKPMMQAVIDLARRFGIGGEASLDENMACGIGACLGCVVKTDQGYVPSCTHGPVFSFDEIKGQLSGYATGCYAKER